ncbi:MAG: hypothetical protein AAF828_01170 [Bacteroidota bacterium]
MTTIKERLFNLLFLALLIFAGAKVQAQITSEMMSMSQGSHEALVLELPGADDKMVQKLWMDFTKKNYKAKTKRDRKSDEYRSLNIEIPGVSVGSMVDMYAKVNERGSGSELAVWIGSNDGWINPESLPDRYVEAEKMMMRFALDVSREQIRLQVIEEEKMLKELEKDLESLKRDKDKYLKAIEKAKQVIADSEAAIIDNEKSQEDKAKEIEDQRKVVEDTKKKGDF